MRTKATLLTMLLLLLIASSSFALDGPQPEAVTEKMSFKLVRGLTNTATCIVEVPKQTYLMSRDRGAIAYVVGPMKGVGMMVYRLFCGLTETAFFAVPQPGYYDPMLEPEFVWQGWEQKRAEPKKQEAEAVKEGE